MTDKSHGLHMPESQNDADTPHSGFKATAQQRWLNLRSAARRGLLGLHQAFHCCAEDLAREATICCKQLYIAACNRIFRNPQALSGADHRCIDAAWERTDAANDAAHQAAKRTFDSLQSDLPQHLRHQRNRLSTADISYHDYNGRYQDT